MLQRILGRQNLWNPLGEREKLAGIYGLSFPQNMVQLLNAENQFPLMF